ncbi:MAG TPA: threonine/serine dehydratase [bacterium]|nr:threonine/serine dehydratase [bacterium]
MSEPTMHDAPWTGPLPAIHDVLMARRVIAPHLPRTPLVHAPALDRALDARVYVKCENLLPTGAFKVRGGINLVHALSPDERRRGVITASTGNHGQSIAYAAHMFGVRATIVAPRGNNPLKVAAMRALGAEVVLEGRDFDEAREWAERTAEAGGLRYVHSANEPLLIAGVGTASLEVLEDVPDVDVIVVPIGAGSGACGHCIVAKALNPRVRVIGVQAEGANPVERSLREGRMVSLERMETFAEGIATRVPFALPLAILRAHLDEAVLVTDEEMRRAILVLAQAVRQTAEGAGAASTAAAFRIRERLRGKTVVLILSGGNITLDSLRDIYADPTRVDGVAGMLRTEGSETARAARDANAPEPGEGGQR